MTKVCLVLSGKTWEDNQEAINRYRNSIDLAELRADFLLDEDLKRLDDFPRNTDLPLVLTIRRKSDGGRFAGTEEERKRLYLRGIQGGYKLVDLESDSAYGDVEETCAEKGIRIIRSLHDFQGVPDNLADVLKKLPHRSGEIPKMAVMPYNTADTLAVFEALRSTRQKERILLGMGAWGFPTRVLAGKFSCFLTYCSPEGKSAAPGHIDPDTLQSIYRFRSVNPGSDVYAVIGNPVMHSRSPWIHNPALTALNLDAVYVPFQVDDVQRFFSYADKLDLKGVSVTVPHKESVKSVLFSFDSSVEAITSCNTVFPRNGNWQGTNSDAPGFVQPLLSVFGKSGLDGIRATVIGAGGTARAAVFALVEKGAEVLIVNRTVERARQLAEQFGCAYGALNPKIADSMRSFADLIVQTTSCGMHPDVDNDPLPFYQFSGDEVVYDVIYTPPETQFLGRARKAGCRTLNGKKMLLEQAFIQFRYFTGREFPPELKDSIEI